MKWSCALILIECALECKSVSVLLGVRVLEECNRVARVREGELQVAVDLVAEREVHHQLLCDVEYQLQFAVWVQLMLECDLADGPVLERAFLVEADLSLGCELAQILDVWSRESESHDVLETVCAEVDEVSVKLCASDAVYLVGFSSFEICNDFWSDEELVLEAEHASEVTFEVFCSCVGEVCLDPESDWVMELWST